MILAIFFLGKTKKEHKENSMMPAGMQKSLTFEEYEQKLSANLSDNALLSWKSLSAALDKSANDTATYRKNCILMADFWKTNQNPSLFAYYNYLKASSTNTAPDLENAGNTFLEVYKNNPDSLISNNLVTFALRSLEKAAEKDGSNVGLKIKIAELYVQTSPEPMKGISMLRALGDSLPENMDVQMSLARLSLQSGQMDKAKERLQKVLQKQPQNTEALYFMAITEAQMGHADEAIRLLELCKTLVNNEEFSNEINNLIQDIKNKKV